jgi:hypothetical protein
MSNGDRSQQRDEPFDSTEEDFETIYDHIMPEGANKRIRFVEIYSKTVKTLTYIVGFSFLDKDSQVIWRIGNVWQTIPDSDEELSD